MKSSRPSRRAVHLLLRGLGTCAILAILAAGAGLSIDGSQSSTPDPSSFGSDTPRPLTPAMINGTMVAPTDFTARWGATAQLLSNAGQVFCGGTLVAPTIVVTAAHCVVGETPATMQVATGRRVIGEAAGQVGKVTSITVHPSFDPVAIINDVAVLKLANARTATPISVVGPGEDSAWGNGIGRIPTPADGPWIAGWGNRATDGVRDFPNELYEQNLPIRADQFCADPVVSFGARFDPAVDTCVGIIAQGDGSSADPSGNGACNGDSGGPLLVHVPDGWRLVGVTSYGAIGCRTLTASAYTRLSTYRTWLQDLGVPIGASTYAAPPAPDLGGRDGAGTIDGVAGGGPAGQSPVHIVTPVPGATLAATAYGTDLEWVVPLGWKPDHVVVVQPDGVATTTAVQSTKGHMTFGTPEAGTWTWTAWARRPDGQIVSSDQGSWFIPPVQKTWVYGVRPFGKVHGRVKGKVKVTAAFSTTAASARYRLRVLVKRKVVFDSGLRKTPRYSRGSFTNLNVAGRLRRSLVGVRKVTVVLTLSGANRSVVARTNLRARR